MDALMNKKSLGKFNRIELRIYETLGVKLFRKVILLFEKIKHHKDGGQNVNYHLRGASINALNSFSGYLLYNTMFHIVSMLFVLLYFIITRSMQYDYLWIDIIMYVTVAFNLYCIMLQRYIHLKIKSHICKMVTKREQRIQTASDKLSSFLEKKNDDEFLEEYNIIQKIALSMDTGAECTLGTECTEALDRLAVATERVEVAILPRARVKINDVSLHQVLSNVANQTHLIGRVEQRVSKLQRFLKRPITNNVLFGYSIITEDSKCEAAFCRLFPVRNREKMEFTIAVLLTAYQQKGLVKR